MPRTKGPWWRRPAHISGKFSSPARSAAGRRPGRSPLPLGLDSIRIRPLREIYRDDPLLMSIRAARFTGPCGSCEYADLYGGSRARNYATAGDPLGEDPACPYVPGAATPS